MPRFSIIIPVFKVQAYLRECLDSVLTQSFTDIEVIAVDDCSPDKSGLILDEYADRDARLRVLHLPENVGLGRARNAGVREASGEYLLFLDSDDTYTAGALAAMSAHLDESGDPDLLFFDHVRTYWWGRVAKSVFGALLASTGTDAVSLDERPDLIDLFAVAWNKAYRREWYLAGELAFEPGLYEDAPLAYEAMVTATAMTCLPRVCVEYRQRRQGAITRSPGRKHFEIFPQYASLFAYLDKHPELDRFRPELFRKMVTHFIFCIQREQRVLPADRRGYFQHMHLQYKRFVPDGFVPPEGSAGLKFRMVERGSYAQFAAVKATEMVRSKSVKKARSTKHKVGRKAYERYYQLQRALPIDENLVVYSAYWNRAPACNPLAIYEKAKELAPHLHGVWIVRPGEVDKLPEGVDYVLPHSRRYWEVIARAKYLVSNVNFHNHMVKRPGQVHIQTHHGTPLKKMGLDQRDYPASANGMSFGKLLERVDRWDYSITSNHHSTEIWERVYPSAFESVETGYPRNDAYYRAGAREVLDIRERLGIAPDRIALLYAPTMRDYQKGFMPRLDLERLAATLGDKYVVLVRAHYFYGANPQLQELQERGAIIDVSKYPVVEDLGLAADALITDYSSIMFDYANLDRPIISYIPDWEVYVKARGVYFDLTSGKPGETPGALAMTEEQLIDVFTSGEWKSPRADRLRAAFRARFCQYDDGFAADRAVRHTMLGEDALPEILPLDRRAVPPTPAEAARLLDGGAGLVPARR